MRNEKTICLFLAATLCWLCACENNPVFPDHTQPEPYVVIEHPAQPRGVPSYAEVIVFRWKGIEGRHIDSVRYFWSQVVDTNGSYNPAFDMMRDLNENPWRYLDRWSPWTNIDAPGDSGTATILGDNESLRVGRLHLFAVQARNRLGDVTRTFTIETNVRLFVPAPQTGPLLLIFEPILSGFKFIGRNLNVQRRKLPGGVPLRFKWSADADYYGGEVAGYRYGWDITSLSAWDAPFSPLVTSTPETAFNTGAHTLSIEAVDQAGNITTGRIEIETIPFSMDRNLLLVDDFYSTYDSIPDYSLPPEFSHDEFWLGLCARAAGFDPVSDIYDCFEHNLTPPDLEYVGHYKNIVWTYSNSLDVWGDIVLFTLESGIGQTGDRIPNIISVFLRKGGHVWTLGRSDRGGGLAAVLDRTAQSFPLNLACEISGNRDDCDGDRSGVYSMAYQDYCVTVLDKIKGIFRSDYDMPDRIVDHYDVMMFAYKDPFDFVTASCPEFPERLDLWEEVTDSGRYFEPDTTGGPGGFTYVEIYDPAYWMTRRSLSSQACFHPLYRMRAKNEQSPLDDCVVAVWVTRYDDVVPTVSSGAAVAAPSVHFGFPLWFFGRQAADSIGVAIFGRWGIAKE